MTEEWESNPHIVTLCQPCQPMSSDMAGGAGTAPALSESKSDVLLLYEPPISRVNR